MMKKNIFTRYLLLFFLLILFSPVPVFSAVPPEDEETDAPVIFSESEKTANTVTSGSSRKIPDSIVSVSSGYVIVVDKKFQKIYVFRKSETFVKVFEAPCSTGKNSGSKQMEGDEKTPNGIFFATKILHNPGPPETYGSLAFPLDYPTLSDKRAGKNGNNIWIHGTTKSLLPKQSSGCVVLRDSDLKRLANFICLNRTPVIISESIRWVPQNHVPASKNELDRILTAWNRAFNEKDINKIDSLYMQGTEIKGKRREELHNKIKNMKFINRHFDLQPRDISVLQEGNNAVIIFDQIFDVNSNNTFQGFYNKLILEKIGNRWYVVDDATPSTVGKKTVLAKSTEKRLNSLDDMTKKDIQKLVHTWLTSWESGDMETYRRCYAQDFLSREMGLDAWITHKSTVRQKSESIRIQIENLQISADGDNAQASFTQHYSSSVLKSKGRKTLELKKTDDQWKIYREIM